MKPCIIYFSPTFSTSSVLSSKFCLQRVHSTDRRKTQCLNLIPQLYKGAPAVISKVVRFLSFGQNTGQNDKQAHSIETCERLQDNSQLASFRGTCSFATRTGNRNQCFSNFVRPRPGKLLFFHKTRARSQQIYS